MGYDLDNIFGKPSDDDKQLDNVFGKPRNSGNSDDRYLSNIAKGFKSGGAGVIGGMFDLVHGEDYGGDYMNNVVQNNQRSRDYDSIFSLDYLTDPSGLTYDVSNQVGSMAALAPAAVLAPEGLVGAGATGAGRLLTGLGSKKVAQWATGQAGQKALQLGVRGAATAIPESMSEGGNTRREAIELGLDNPDARAWEVTGENMLTLPISNGLEYMLLGGKLFKPSAKVGEGLAERAVKAPIRSLPAVGAGAAQQGTEELLQQTYQDSALDTPVGNVLNPWDWTDSQKQAFQVGLAGSVVLGGAGSGYRSMRVDNTANNTNSIDTGATNVEMPNFSIANNVEDSDLSHTNTNLVDRVKVLNSWATDNLGQGITVTSGWRSPENNAAVNGAERSHHLDGNAMDISTEGLNDEQRQALFQKAGELGFNTDPDVIYHDKGSGYHMHLQFADNDQTGNTAVNSNLSKEDFFNKVAGQESGGNYDAENGRTGAFGKYQIMPGNWFSWSQEAGLPEGSEMTKENQEIVARYKLGDYYDKYGPEGALVAWYSGENNAQRWVDGKKTALGENGEYSWDAKQGAGNEPSVREYVQQALGRSAQQGKVRSSGNSETPAFNITDGKIIDFAGDFADYMRSTSSDPETINFFEDKFNSKNKFIDTPENRKEIEEKYGEQLKQYIEQQKAKQEDNQTQSMIDKALEKQNPQQMQTPADLSPTAVSKTSQFEVKTPNLDNVKQKQSKWEKAIVTPKFQAFADRALQGDTIAQKAIDHIPQEYKDVLMQQAQNRLQTNNGADTNVSTISQQGDQAAKKFEVTPAGINNKTWYHGTGTNNLTADMLDTNSTKIDGLFGHGIYLTDNPKIAEGYANARSQRTNTPTIYESKVNVGNVLNLEKPMPENAYNIFRDMAKNISDRWGDAELLKRVEKTKGESGEKTYKEFSKGIEEISQDQQLPSNEFVEDFQDLSSKLKEAGYDAYTHVGGKVTGKNPHQVLIMLDPNETMSQSGRKGQITSFKPIKHTSKGENVNEKSIDTKTTLSQDTTNQNGNNILKPSKTTAKESEVNFNNNHEQALAALPDKQLNKIAKTLGVKKAGTKSREGFIEKIASHPISEVRAAYNKALGIKEDTNAQPSQNISTKGSIQDQQSQEKTLPQSNKAQEIKDNKHVDEKADSDTIKISDQQKNGKENLSRDSKSESTSPKYSVDNKNKQKSDYNKAINTDSNDTKTSSTKALSDEDVIDIIKSGMGVKIKMLKADKLSEQQKRISSVGDKFNCPVHWFNGPSYMRGFHMDGKTFLNNKGNLSVKWAFWHETFHWMRNNNSALYEDMLKHVKENSVFTQKQIDEYKDQLGRYELTDDEAIEEMLADYMADVARRVELFKELGKKNPTLVERLVSWVRDMMDKFHEFYGVAIGLNKEQQVSMIKSFASLAKDIKDSDGNRIFTIKSNGDIVIARNENSVSEALNANTAVAYSTEKSVDNSKNKSDTVNKEADFFKNSKNFTSVQKKIMVDAAIRAIDNIDRNVSLKTTDDFLILREKLLAGIRKTRDEYLAKYNREKNDQNFETLQNIQKALDYERWLMANERRILERLDRSIRSRNERGSHETLASDISRLRSERTGRDGNEHSIPIGNIPGEYKSTDPIIQKIRNEYVETKHSEEQKRSDKSAFSMSKSNDTHDSVIQKFIDDSLAGKTKDETLLIGKVTQNEANKIFESTGIDVNGYMHCLDSNDIRHIVNNHGVGKEKQKSQIPLIDDDLKSIPDILNSPDSIEKGTLSRREGFPTIRYLKEDSKGINTVVEVVRSKDKKLVVKTMWKKIATKLHADQTISPPYTSESGNSNLSSTIKNSIPQSAKNIQQKKEVSGANGEGYGSTEATTSKPMRTRQGGADTSFIDNSISQNKNNIQLDKNTKESDKSTSSLPENVKYSAETSDKTGTLFSKPAGKLLGKLGFKTKENPKIKVALEKINHGDGMSLLDWTLSSPARIAQKVPGFTMFFKWADNAMNKLTKLRADFNRKFSAALDMVKDDDDRAKLFEILWNGDLTSKEWTKQELIDAGEKENIAEAYIRIRRLMTKAYQLLNNARRREQTYNKELVTDSQFSEAKKNLSSSDFNDYKLSHISQTTFNELKENKFVTILKEHDNGLVTYKEAGNWKQTYHDVNEEALSLMEKNDAIQILNKEKVGVDENGKDLYTVETRESIPDINKLTGYIPHFFHEFFVKVKVKDSEAENGFRYETIDSGRNLKESTAKAEEYLKNNPDAELVIQPKQFDFTKVGMSDDDSAKFAATIGDKDYFKMTAALAKENNISFNEAKEMLNGTVKIKGRHRFFGNMMQRKGAAGYEKEMTWVLTHYFNSTSRYVALETEFKPKAISLFERLYGDFNKDHKGLAHYVKDYINDINGSPSNLETIINNALNSNKYWQKYAVSNFGDRAALQLTGNITGTISILKLGVFNVSSAMLNFTQLLNSAALIGDISAFYKCIRKGSQGKYSMHDKKILVETGVMNDIGFDSAAGYGNSSMNFYGKVMNKKIPLTNKTIGQLPSSSMYFFKKTEAICRRGTVLAAYQKGIEKGMTHKKAIEYAKEVNDKANFEYGVHDAPNVFRRGSIFSQLLLQFKKYPIKEFELMMEMLSNKTDAKQKAVFWGGYFLIAGLLQIPAIDWFDDMWKEITGTSLKMKAKKSMFELAGRNPELAPLVKLAVYGIGSPANIDLSSRAGVGDAMPKLSSKISEFAGPAANTIYSTISNFIKGDTMGTIQSFSPGLANIIMAASGEKIGARGRVMSTYETGYEKLLRLVGFKSVDESVATDRKSILHDVNVDKQSEHQNAIDAFIEDPSSKNAAELKRLNIKPKTVQEERKKKQQDKDQRTGDMSKKEKQEYRDLMNFNK